MITEDYTTKEVAELLQRKGFLAQDKIRKAYRKSDGTPINSEGNFDYDNEVPCPTVQMALKWLREVKHIDIIVSIYCNHHDGSLEYMADVYRWGGKIVTPLFTGRHDKVVENAMIYVLEQLDF
jgi:hypothetical protein